MEGRVSVLTSTSKEPARIAGMFDAIARRYDTLNHLLSAGMDRRWRRRAVTALALTGRERVLDMCTGTADLAIEAATSGSGRAAVVIGVDFSNEMLRHAAPKIRAAGLVRRVQLVRGDATLVPLPDASCDAAMVAFGIRNVQDPVRGCHFRREPVPPFQRTLRERRNNSKPHPAQKVAACKPGARGKWLSLLRRLAPHARIDKNHGRRRRHHHADHHYRPHCED